ncbi:hypothetical protein EYC84_010653 [Monilinia fructicola]|uniref:NADP-dependent oxidoreductase domain-containing protein n=1 Tax=Monilinia fructicola TaxID=38448 RepID=A0A5M9J988_MONFR|nr:hypothetical protein EYC84_010653 [Monilinia fructicola]
MPLIATSPKPRIILGLMNFGPDPSTGARITSLDEYNTVLDHFQAAGYNEVDTARTYVGATKVYPTEAGLHTEAELTRRFETSLKELGTDCIDIFYLPRRRPLRAIHRDARRARQATQTRQIPPARPLQLHRLRGLGDRPPLQVQRLGAPHHLPRDVQRHHAIARPGTHPRLQALRPLHRDLQSAGRRALLGRIPSLGDTKPRAATATLSDGWERCIASATGRSRPLLRSG